MTSSVNATLLDHLLQHFRLGKRQEDLSFALWHPSSGRSRKTALVYQPVLPRSGDRTLHGNVSFNAHYFERALGDAMDAGSGLVFLHSHPSAGWQGMSKDDIAAERQIASTVLSATSFPLVGMTVGTDGSWSARIWVRTGPGEFQRTWCATVRVVGERLSVTFMDALAPAGTPGDELRRTVSAWGRQAQDDLSRLRIGVVGLGSVGSIISEILARMGIEDLVLIDFDTVKRHNLDRLLHATAADIGKLKVEICARELRSHATAANFRVEEIPYAVTEPQGYAAALDCDLLFSAVDRPWGRSAQNFIAYTHLIPVIDGGVLIRTSRTGDLRGADWKAHTIAPTRRCMECLEQYTPGDVTLERDGFLDDPEYIKGLPSGSVLNSNQNVIPFAVGAAHMQVLQMLSYAIAPNGIADVGCQCFHMVTGHLDQHFLGVGCLDTCPYPGMTAAGDSCAIQVTGPRVRSRSAELTRR